MEKRFEIALHQALAELTAMPEVTGILFFGSVQRGEATPTSDLDLFAVVKGGQCWSRKKFVEGVEVEVCFSPFCAWQKKMEDCQVTIIQAFATGSILLDRSGDLARLVDLGKTIWANGPQPLDSVQIENWRIKLSMLISDVEGFPPGSLEARFLGCTLLSSALEAYCALNCLWAAKPKRLIGWVSAHNPELGRKVAGFYQPGNFLPGLAIAIADQVLAPFGGRLLEYDSFPVSC